MIDKVPRRLVGGCQLRAPPPPPPAGAPGPRCPLPGRRPSAKPPTAPSPTPHQPSANLLAASQQRAHDDRKAATAARMAEDEQAAAPAKAKSKRSLTLGLTQPLPTGWLYVCAGPGPWAGTREGLGRAPGHHTAATPYVVNKPRRRDSRARGAFAPRPVRSRATPCLRCLHAPPAPWQRSPAARSTLCHPSLPLPHTSSSAAVGAHTPCARAPAASLLAPASWFSGSERAAPVTHQAVSGRSKQVSRK